MLRDMERAGYALRTREHYIGAIRQMTQFLKRPPDLLDPEDIRAWDDEMERRGNSPQWKAIHVAALLFLYRRTLGKPEMVSFLSYCKRKPKLPVVLSQEEASRLLSSIREPRLRVFYTLIYDTGLRITEAAQLKAGDIDHARGVIHVRSGKGGKPRQVKLSEQLYEILRSYWREVRSLGPRQEPLTQESLLFVNQRGGPLSFDSVRKALALAARTAGITRRVTPHCLRHSYATAQLEAGVDLRVLQAQMGHAGLNSTQIYLHVSTRLIRQTPSPLDSLPPP
jgi:site-specific recombinase XerD